MCLVFICVTVVVLQHLLRIVFLKKTFVFVVFNRYLLPKYLSSVGVLSNRYEIKTLGLLFAIQSYVGWAGYKLNKKKGEVRI